MTYYIRIKDNIVYMKGEIESKLDECLYKDLIIIEKEEYDTLETPSTIEFAGDKRVYTKIKKEDKKQEELYLSTLEEAVLGLADRELGISLIDPLDVITCDINKVANKINEILKVLGGN